MFGISDISKDSGIVSCRELVALGMGGCLILHLAQEYSITRYTRESKRKKNNTITLQGTKFTYIVSWDHS